MVSLLEGLKKRRLVQWTIAYLAGAWVVIEATSLIVGQFGWPAVVAQAVTVLAAFGFPITLVLAWYHGERGRQRVTGPELLMVAALLAVAGVAVSVLPGEEEGPQPEQRSVPMLVDDDRPSIAVLPCENISPDPSDAYLADGIHEEILVRLQRISSLRSIGRSSVLGYRENPSPVGQIAQVLGVGFVGECSVRKDPNREQVRLTFQLLDAAGAQIWAETYDRDLTTESLFAMESNVASQVAASVRAEIIPEERARMERIHTENLSAYEAYLLGRHYLRPGPSLSEAIRFFELSVREDSTFALGYAGLAEAYDYLASTGGVSPPEAWLRVEREARNALRLDSTLAEPWVALGDARMISWDWTGAEEAFRQAVELRPGFGTAHQMYSLLLVAQGRGEQALASSQIAVEVSPVDPGTHAGYAARLVALRRYDEAVERLTRALRLDPMRATSLWWQTIAYTFADAPDRAFETVGSVQDSTTALSLNALIHARVGNVDTARAMLRDLEARSSTEYVDPMAFWPTYAALGEEDKAFAWLDRSIEAKSYGTIYLGVAPFADPLRDDPRYQVLLDRIGLGQLAARFDSLAAVSGSARR